MSCPNNKKKFLFWEYDGSHNRQIIAIQAHYSKALYEVAYDCRYCGCQFETRAFVSEEELQQYGLDVKKLQELHWKRGWVNVDKLACVDSILLGN